MSTALMPSRNGVPLPALIARAGQGAARRFLELFAVTGI